MMLKRDHTNRYALAIAGPLIVAIVAGAFLVALPAGAADDPRLAQAQEQVRAYCTDLVDDTTTTRQRNTRADLCAMWTRQLADLQPSPTTTTPPATTAPPTTPPPTPTPTPTTTPAAWPGEGNTGVPAGVTLTTYTGCTLTIANITYTARTFNCSPLYVQASGVTITNSRVNGYVRVSVGGSLVLTDSEISAPAGQTGIDGSNYTVIRGDIFGGNRQGNCDVNCSIRDSWLHGTRIYPASQHASGFRLGQYTTLTHNVITCEAPQNSSGGGCSAPITGYPDFAPLHHNTVAGNLIPGSPHSAFCAYGGATSGKDYSDDSTNATYIVFRDNVFGRGTTGKCAMYGPISDFAFGRTGNVWSNNRYEDGALI
jgi:hypothetical protein